MEGCLERYSGKPIREWDEWWVPFVVPNVPVEKCLWIAINGKTNAIHCVWMFLFSSFCCDASPFLICFLHVLYIFVLFFKCIFFGFSVSLLVWRFFFILSAFLQIFDDAFEISLIWGNLADITTSSADQNKTDAMLLFSSTAEKRVFFLRCATLPLSSTLPFIFLILSCF